jgi:nitrate reductase NapA
MTTEQQKTRRDFLRTVALQAAYAAVAAYVPGVLFEAPTAGAATSPDVAWKKAPCRFCGTGCGLLIGLQAGRAVAVKGDPTSPVNKGLLCVKGYHSVLALYGSDRLTQALVRKDGKLVPVPISEALDLVASRLKETVAQHGKDAVAIYGSGQWTIPEGYAASKLFKGGIGTNNVEANARLCMASAVTGFMTSFGMDEPMGCYEDIDHADVFVLWGNNMAEMHPVLFSRLLARRQAGKRVRIIDLATRRTRTSQAADVSLMFKPQTDLAIANAIAWVLVSEGRYDKAFVERCCQLMAGKTGIGYGLEDDFKFKDEPRQVAFADYVKFLEDYRPEQVERLSGVAAKDIRYLASLYGDPSLKVMSLWCMGMNQHTRGTWINNLVYNLHLLTGKIASPGNSPFSLTGQPSACGTVREVGTLTNRLPHGTVDDPHAREMAAKIWNVPVERIPDKPTYHTVAMFRALDAGKIRFLWIQTTNPMVTMPKLKRYRDAALKEDRFIVVSDVYPTPTTDIADVVLPSAFWIEREGMWGNSERRTQHFEKMVEPPGEAMPDAWQLIEVAKRLGFAALFPYGKETHAKELFEEYRKFHEGPEHNMATYEELRSRPGVMWPIVDGKETKWRYNAAYDPAAKPGEARDFYGTASRRANIWLRPYEAPPEVPDEEYPFWLNTGRVLEHWHSGSLTRRIDVLHRARPHAYVEVNRKDAERLGLRHGDSARLTSRRGSITLPVVVEERGDPPEGQVFVPFFDESALINELTLDAYCPISAQPDYKKCAVKLERA